MHIPRRIVGCVLRVVELAPRSYVKRPAQPPPEAGGGANTADFIDFWGVYTCPTNMMNLPPAPMSRDYVDPSPDTVVD